MYVCTSNGRVHFNMLQASNCNRSVSSNATCSTDKNLDLLLTVKMQSGFGSPPRIHIDLDPCSHVASPNVNTRIPLNQWSQSLRNPYNHLSQDQQYSTVYRQFKTSKTSFLSCKERLYQYLKILPQITLSLNLTLIKQHEKFIHCVHTTMKLKLITVPWSHSSEEWHQVLLSLDGCVLGMRLTGASTLTQYIILLHLQTCICTKLQFQITEVKFRTYYVILGSDDMTFVRIYELQSGNPLFTEITLKIFRRNLYPLNF